MPTLQGSWGRQGATAYGTFEEMDELVHGRRGIVAKSGLFKERSRDQVPQVM